jgi:hypothetical protein
MRAGGIDDTTMTDHDTHAVADHGTAHAGAGHGDAHDTHAGGGHGGAQDAHAADTLGPIDLRMWGVGALGVIVAVVVAAGFVLATAFSFTA